MLDTEMRPFFKRGDYDGGVLTGVRKIAGRLYTIDVAKLDRVAVTRQQTSAAGNAAVGVAAIGGAAMLYAQSELTKPVCRRCGKRMRSKDGSAWSAEERVAESKMVQRLLTREEVVEQRIGACTFQLYACTNPECALHRADATRREGWGEVNSSTLESMVIAKDTVGVRRAKTGRFTDCVDCGVCALQTETHVVLRATTHRTGRKVRFRNCLHCGFADERIFTTPMITESSGDSGGGGGGDFGGGSSGGGGSGTSW